MNRVMLSLVLVLLALLTACNSASPIVDDDPDPIPLECTENQIKVNEECIDLTGSELQLRDALNQSQELDNYAITVSIIEGEQTQSFTMYFDRDVALFESSLEQDYYRRSDSICEHKHVSNGISQTETMDCDSQDDLLFMFDVEYTMFTLENGVYSMDEPYHSMALEGLNRIIDAVVLHDVTLSIAYGYISTITYDLSIDDVHLLVQMEYHTINEVELNWDVVS